MADADAFDRVADEFEKAQKKKPTGLPSLLPFPGARTETSNDAFDRAADQFNLTQFGLGMLPSVGGTAGGYAGAALGSPFGPTGVIAGRTIGAGLGGGGGQFLKDYLENQRGVPGAPQTPGEYLKSAATEGGIQAGFEGAGSFLTDAMGRFFSRQRLYRSALQPTGKQAARAVEAGIHERVPLTPDALDTVGSKIKELDDAIERTIAGTPANISPAEYVKTVQRRFDALRADAKYSPLKSQDYLKQIENAERRFLIDHGNVPSTVTWSGGNMRLKTPEEMSLAELRANAQPITAGDAQSIKKKAWNDVRRMNQAAFDPHAPVSVDVEATQEIGEAMLEEITNIWPQLRNLGRREGGLIELEKQVQRWTNREMNRRMRMHWVPDVVGALAGGGGAHFLGLGLGETAGLGASAGFAAEMMMRMMEDPSVKSRLAIALSRAGGLGAKTGKVILQQTPRAAGTWLRQEFPTEPPPSEEELQAEPPATPRSSTAPSAPRAGLSVSPKFQSLGSDLRNHIVTVAGRYGVPPAILGNLVMVESAGNPKAIGPRTRTGEHALGLTQLMPGTAKQYGVRDPFNPYQSIEGAARYLRDLNTRYGNWRIALAAYNAGPDAVDRAGGRVPNYAETRDYVDKIMPR